MSGLDKLLELSVIARTLVGGMAYRRFIQGMVAVMLLTVITGTLVSSLLIGLFYAAYVCLVRHGLEADAAMVVVGGGVGLVTLAFAIVTIHFIRKLRDIMIPISAIPHVRRIVKAFMDGLSESEQKEKVS